MSLDASKLAKVFDAIAVADDAATVIKGLLSAIRRRKWKQVDQIMPSTLKTELAMAAAEARAIEKFGGADDPDEG